MPSHDSRPRVAILGLGLLGGSLGLALRAASPPYSVAGYDARSEITRLAAERGVIDEAGATVTAAVAGAGLIILATPISAMPDLLREVALAADPGAVITDVGSTKARMCQWAGATLPYPERFVGGHPMAGSEQAGLAHADGNLFRECVWCLTPEASSAPVAVETVERMVRAVHARPLMMDARRHDDAVALVSHVPLAVAAALIHATAGSPLWPDARVLAASGFRDTTRIASGDPEMARDIFLTNSEPVVAGLDACISTLVALREHIASHDPAVEATFRAARSSRDAWLATREGGS